MQNLINSLNELIQSYPEAPYVIAVLGVLFTVSLLVIARELTTWFLKTSKIQNQYFELQAELKDIRLQLAQMNEQFSSQPMPFNELSKVTLGLDPEVVVPPPVSSVKVENKIFAHNRASNANEAKKERGFPLSH